MAALTSEEAVHRGQRAAAILGDPMVVDVLAQIEAQYMVAWRKVESTPEQRETSWSMIQHLDLFRAAFETYIRSGQVAASNIKDAERQKKAGNSEP